MSGVRAKAQAGRTVMDPQRHVERGAVCPRHSVGGRRVGGVSAGSQVSTWGAVVGDGEGLWGWQGGR